MKHSDERWKNMKTGKIWTGKHLRKMLGVRPVKTSSGSESTLVAICCEFKYRRRPRVGQTVKILWATPSGRCVVPYTRIR